VAADRWSGPAPWMSVIPHKGDIRSHFLDREPASSLDFLGWRGAVMSPFYPEGDLAGTPVSFSPSVRRQRGSQVGQDVRRQNTTVRRYAPRVIRPKRAQKVPRFPGIARDVLAPLHIIFHGVPNMDDLPRAFVEQALGEPPTEVIRQGAAARPPCRASRLPAACARPTPAPRLRVRVPPRTTPAC
jgi:hypothetical protein